MATRGSIAEKEQAVGMQGCTAPAPVPRLDPAAALLFVINGAAGATEIEAKRAVIGDENLYAELKDPLAGTNTEVAAGRTAIIDAAAEKVDYTMAAIVGMAGLEPILAAIANGQCVN